MEFDLLYFHVCEHVNNHYLVVRNYTNSEGKTSGIHVYENKLNYSIINIECSMYGYSDCSKYNYTK